MIFWFTIVFLLQKIANWPWSIVFCIAIYNACRTELEIARGISCLTSQHIRIREMWNDMWKYKGCYCNVEMLPILGIKYKPKRTKKPIKFIQ